VYPISFEAYYEAEGRNRLTTFFRSIVVLPWALVGVFWALAAGLLAIVAWFAILVTGRYPEGLYDFMVKEIRFMARVNAFGFLLTDRFPPFSGAPDDGYAVRLEAKPPKPEYSRVKVLLRLVLWIPVFLLAYVQGVIGGVCALIAWFAIVFTGRVPESIFNAIRSAVAYQARATAYILLLTEDYPPFEYDESLTSHAACSKAAPE
jgi:hypothetical protein